MGGAGAQPLAVLDAPTQARPVSFYAIAVWDGAQQEATIWPLVKPAWRMLPRYVSTPTGRTIPSIFLEDELLSCPRAGDTS